MNQAAPPRRSSLYLKNNQEYQRSLYQKRLLASKLLDYFQRQKSEILTDRAKSFKFVACFNKSKQSLRPVAEALTEHFMRKAELLGSWALLRKDAGSFRGFVEGSTVIMGFYVDLMTNLLHYWAEDQFFKVCLERFLFKVVLVWNAFFEKINQVRHFIDCRIWFFGPGNCK